MGAAACLGSAGVRRGARCAERGRCAGEIPWVARIIEQYHDRAAQKGVKIVPCCGFDSIPSDLSAFLVATHIRDKLNRRARAAGRRAASVACAAHGRRSVPCAMCAGCPAVRAHSGPLLRALRPTKEVTLMVGPAKGGVSGGTIASLVAAAFDETAEHRARAADPYGLLPPGAARGPDKPDYWGAPARLSALACQCARSCVGAASCARVPAQAWATAPWRASGTCRSSCRSSTRASSAAATTSTTTVRAWGQGRQACAGPRPARAPRRGARAEGAEGRWVRAASAHACGAGDNFSYHEVQEAGGPVVAALGTAALAIGFAALRFARPIVLRFLPKPGEGPSVEMQVRAPGRVRARAAAPAGDMPCPQ